MPTMAIIKNKKAAPDPFPTPKNIIKMFLEGRDDMKGSNILSTMIPPRK